MKNFFLVFSILMVAWTECSVAHAESDKYYLVDGLFFNGMPPGITMDDATGFAELNDGEGHLALDLFLGRNKSLPAYALPYRVPVEQVPGGQKLLELSRSGSEKVISVRTVNTVILDKWIGKPFPDFKVKDTTGRIWTKDDILGKSFVLNFWYIGCRPCIREMPELNEWMRLCPLETYFATTWNTAEQIKNIVESRPFLFTHIADDLFFFNQFKVQVTPTTILVDKKGIIRYWEEGGSKAKRQYLLDKLKELETE